MSKIKKYIKYFVEEVKSAIDYLMFRDMGNMGEGCLVSLFIWGLVIMGIVLFITVI